MEYHLLKDMSYFSDLDSEYKKFYVIILTQPTGSFLNTEIENDNFMIKFAEHIRENQIEVIPIG